MTVTASDPNARALVEQIHVEIPPGMTRSSRVNVYEDGRWLIKIDAWNSAFDGTSAVFEVCDTGDGLEAVFVSGRDW